jgi:hypothetical protein
VWSLLATWSEYKWTLKLVHFLCVVVSVANLRTARGDGVGDLDIKRRAGIDGCKDVLESGQLIGELKHI